MKISPISSFNYSKKVQNPKQFQNISFKNKIQDDEFIRFKILDKTSKTEQTIDEIQKLLKQLQKTTRSSNFCLKTYLFLGKQYDFKGYVPLQSSERHFERLTFRKDSKTNLPTQISKLDISRNFKEMQRFDIPKGPKEEYTYHEFSLKDDCTISCKQKGNKLLGAKLTEVYPTYISKISIIPSKDGFDYVRCLSYEEWENKTVLLPIELAKISKKDKNCYYVLLNKDGEYDVFCKQGKNWFLKETVENLSDAVILEDF